MVAEAASVVNAAPCLHLIKDAITSTAEEIGRGNIPPCDFNLAPNGDKHQAASTPNQV